MRKPALGKPCPLQSPVDSTFHFSIFNRSFLKGAAFRSTSISRKFFALLLPAVFLTFAGWAQTTEVFETEAHNATTFTDNGQGFTITSQAGGTFRIQAAYAGYGWNGSSPDNVFIDNDGYAAFNTPVQFTISANGGTHFIANSFYLYLADNNANVAVSGSVTVTGKKAGATVYSATASSGFNQNLGVNNGFSLINLSSFGGQNNANKPVDQIVISTGNNFWYVAMDAFNWTKTNPEINLKGNAASIVDGDLTPSATDHTDFGTTSVCSGNIARTFTIENTGTGPLSITGVSITGTAAADYTVTTAPASTVAAGSSASFVVTFDPSATGSRPATIIINNNDANEAAYDFAVTGTGSSPAVTPVMQTNIACFGGSTGAAAVSVSGGTAPYTYDWTPGTPTGDGTASVSGLTAGTWTCTVTDANGCTASRSFTITQPTALTVNPSMQTNIACFGGSTGAATIATPSGGTPGFMYDWTPGNPTGDGTTSVTGLTAGTWTCTVTDANGCTASRSFTLNQPTAISVTAASQTNVSCLGGSDGAASITTPTGGMPSYSYNWTPGNPSGDGTTSVTGLTAGTWTCTVTDAYGCSKSVSFTITQGTTKNWTGAVSTDWNTASNWCGGVPSATSDVIIPGGTLRQPFITTSGSVQNLTVQAGATLTITGSLNVAGIFSNSGAVNATGGTIVMNGSGSQTIAAATFGANTIKNLVINNPAGVVLGTDLSVTTNLTLTSGHMSLGNYNLTVGSITGGSAVSYLQTGGSGKIKWSLASGAGMMVPVGNSAYNPVMLTNNSGTADEFSVRVRDEVYANGTDGTVLAQNRVQRTWDIGKALPNAGTGIDLGFYWNSGEVVGTMAPPALFHFGNNWVRQSGSTNSTATSLTYTGYTGSFSPFAIIDGSFTLPVHLLNFKVVQQGSVAGLSWNTETEEGSDRFVIQHSVSGANWVSVGSVKAAGNSNTTKQYSFAHNQPVSGINYYRLVQQDLNGKSTYSQVASLRFSGVEKMLEVYPNPAIDRKVTVRLNETSTVRVYNSVGELVLQKKYQPGTQELNLTSLAAGTYYVMANDKSATILVK